MIDIRAVQNRLLEMACHIRCILERYEIPYIITYGTLLGAVRHKGFIPWDDDFDIYLFDDSYDYAISVLKSELPHDLFLEDRDSEPLYFHGWAHVKDLNSEAVCLQFPQDNVYSHHGLSIDLYKASLIPRENLTLFQLQERLNYINRKFRHGFLDNDDYLRTKTRLMTQIDKERQRVILSPDDMIYGFMSLDGDYLEVNEVFPIKAYQFENHFFSGPNRYHDFLTRCYGNYLELPPVEKRKPHYSQVSFHIDSTNSIVQGSNRA